MTRSYETDEHTAPRAVTKASTSVNRGSGAVGRADEAREARIQLMHVLEPQDYLGMALIGALGPVPAAEIVCGRKPSPAEIDKVRMTSPELSDKAEPEGLDKAWERWRHRKPLRNPLAMERTMNGRGAWLATPEDPDWPSALRDLGHLAPIGLWGRGDRAGLSAPRSRNLSVVGCRDATAYGVEVTNHLVSSVAGDGYAILSGAAFGIDAAAHRTALAVGTSSPTTIALLACGIDRSYPRAHHGLLEDIESAGLILTELNPGASPMRHRFLQRNRLIAALSEVIVVVEARFRSGALNTARHGLELGRTVGVVPGPVFSDQSAGCHRMVSEAPVELITCAEDLRVLLPAIPGGDGASGREAGSTSVPETNDPVLSQEQALVRDALPAGRGVAPERLCSVASLPIRTVMASLAHLEMVGLARCEGGLWRITR